MGNDNVVSGNATRVGIARPRVNPGDEAAPGTPGAGENICPDCKGTGRLDNAPCATCGGTGKVIEGIGGG